MFRVAEQQSFPSFERRYWQSELTPRGNVTDFLINLGKRRRHLPWAPVSESIVEHTGRKQMMAAWPYGALVVPTDHILYDRGGNAARRRAVTCFTETESYEVTYRHLL